MMKMFHMSSSSIFLGNKTTTTTALPAAAAAVVTLLLLLVVAPNPACDAFTPKPFVPMSSFLSPDPVNPKTSAISPMLSMANYMSNNGNNNGYYNNGGGGGDYYGGYSGGGYNGDTFRSGRNSNGNFNSFNNGYYYNDNDMYYNGPFMNRRVVGNDYYRGGGGGGGRLDGDYDDYYYRGPYAPPSSADAVRSRSMQFNSNQVGRYNQYRYDYDNYNDDYTRRNRGAPLMNNRRLGNMMNNNNNNINNNNFGSNFANGGRGNGGNGGGLMRYQGNDYMDSNSQSFYNLEGKRVRRYDPMWDNGLYNQDALYDSNNNYLSPQQRQQQQQRYNTNGAGAGAGLRRFDPYFDEGRGYYNPNALYEGQALGTRRYHLDPYYDEDRFGWGGDNTGGRNSRYSRGEYGYDDALLMDQDYRRSTSGYNQRRRPPPSSNVMGSGVGYDDRMERYGRSSGSSGGGGAGSYGVERRGSSSSRGGGGGGGRYGDDGYDYYNGGGGYGGRGGGYGEDYYGPGSARLDERSRYANRPPRIREPFVKNMEDESMENMRNGGKGPRRGGVDSRSAEVSRSNGRDRDYAMSGGGGRGSTINGSYNRGGSTVNGSYYPPPRGEANGGMSIDDLKEML
jgi:hypothetical protein